MNLSRDPHDIHRPVHRLTAGHSDCIVIQNLVSDIDLGSHTGPDGEQSRVKIGPITNILKNMPGGTERRLSDPTRALSSHLGKGRGFTVHPLGHVMAADARKSARAIRHMRRSIMRTPCTKVWRPSHCGLFERGMICAMAKSFKRPG